MHIHQPVPDSLTASPSDRGRGRVRVDDLGGIAHRMALLVFRGLDGQAVGSSPLFPFVLSFLGLAIQTRPSLSQVRRGPTALLLCSFAGRLGCPSRLPHCVDISLRVVWHDVLVESCDEPYGFHIKDALSRLSAFRAWVGGQVTSHLGSIMPDWHDLDYMLKVEVGELGGAPGIRTQRGVLFDMSSPASPPQPLPFAHLAELPTSLSHFPSLLHLAA